MLSHPSLSFFFHGTFSTPSDQNPVPTVVVPYTDPTRHTLPLRSRWEILRNFAIEPLMGGDCSQEVRKWGNCGNHLSAMDMGRE